MLFNYDSLEIVAIVVIVVSSIFIYTRPLNITTPNNDSLINTINPNIEVKRVLSHEPYLPKSSKLYNDAATQIVDTPQYRDIGVQTGSDSLWSLFKQLVKKFLNIDTSGSSVNTPTDVRVDTWMSRLNSNQSVDVNDSESSLTMFRFGTDDDLNNLVDVDDSLSQVGAHIDPTNIPLPDSPIHDGVIYQVWDKVGRYGPNYLFCTNDVGQFTNPEYINSFMSPFI